ncbi:DUF6087 family protein [Embleya scabrispora]|uniref:DUF6087 family protein n=1 Tax=Embleya scabrispora TaxID=159449 RepID=UPI00047797AA|nr:DUF6087 family protein [Embleya scabrispora]MYS86178.1 hypothetical protein [Streptomyces sp. SID5474]
MSEDESLERWAARREMRLRPVGERRAVHLVGPPRAPHVDREAPRVVLEWDGYQWVTLAVVANYIEAARLLYPDAHETALGSDDRSGPRSGSSERRTRPVPGTGRHRRTH